MDLIDRLPQAPHGATDTTGASVPARRYALVRALVAEIPAGRVASYGQIAAMLPGLTARQVGYALSGRRDPVPHALPWHRVVNARGAVSPHAGAADQRRRLEAEGIAFDRRDRLDWSRHRWAGPGHVWFIARGLAPDR
ncbi:hypothetical protein CKO24_11445 [Rhodothalassium salexigens DSM 2132]|nr:hypothetical protein [Rhodothalassium salexigens DSM 2132]